jgi:hypothetical protein
VPRVRLVPAGQLTCGGVPEDGDYRGEGRDTGCQHAGDPTDHDRCDGGLPAAALSERPDGQRVDGERDTDDRQCWGAADAKTSPGVPRGPCAQKPAEARDHVRTEELRRSEPAERRSHTRDGGKGDGEPRARHATDARGEASSSELEEQEPSHEAHGQPAPGERHDVAEVDRRRDAPQREAVGEREARERPPWQGPVTLEPDGRAGHPEGDEGEAREEVHVVQVVFEEGHRASPAQPALTVRHR